MEDAPLAWHPLPRGPPRTTRGFHLAHKPTRYYSRLPCAPVRGPIESIRMEAFSGLPCHLAFSSSTFLGHNGENSKDRSLCYARLTASSAQPPAPPTPPQFPVSLRKPLLLRPNPTTGTAPSPSSAPPHLSPTRPKHARSLHFQFPQPQNTTQCFRHTSKQTRTDSG